MDKNREIYTLEKTRIHLDKVTGLGTFVEFEQPTSDRASEIKRSRTILADLCTKLGLKKEELEALSYADLLFGRKKR